MPNSNNTSPMPPRRKAANAKSKNSPSTATIGFEAKLSNNIDAAERSEKACRRQRKSRTRSLTAGREHSEHKLVRDGRWNPLSAIFLLGFLN